MQNDTELLRRYVRTRLGEDLDPLVKRHLDWVHSCAMRQLGGNWQLAADVTQAVFLVLAEKPPRLGGDDALGAWLFGVTRYAARRAIRAETRRRHHERQAAMRRNETIESAELSEESWREIAPILDELVAELGETDRRSVILRFFQGRSYGELGKTLGVSEEAARKRVTRAVEKLRQKLVANGVAAPAAAISTGLLTYATQPASAAAVSAVAGITSGAAAAPAAVAISKGVGTMIALAKAKAFAAAAVLALLVPAVGVVLFAQLTPRPIVSAPPTSQPRAIASSTTLPAGITEGVAQVQVVDEQGQPVSGAEVFVVQMVRPPNDDLDNATITQSGPIKTDEKGAAKFSGLGSLQTEVGWQQFFYARVSGQKAALHQRNYFKQSTQIPQPDPVRIVLGKSRAITGTVAVPQGFSAQNVQVRAISISISSPGRPEEQSWFYQYLKPFFERAEHLFSAEVGADGKFSIPDLPENARAFVQARGPGLGEAQALVQPIIEQVVELHLEPQATIMGTLRFADSGQPAGQTEMILKPRSAEFFRLPVIIKTDDQGRFRFEGLSEGIYSVHANVLKISDWTMAIPRPIRVAAGQNFTMPDLRLERGIVVVGQTSLDNGKTPVANVGIAAYNPADDPESQTIQLQRSDSNGRFMMRLPVGSSHLYVSSAGKGYRTPPKSDERNVTINPDGSINGSMAFEVILDPGREKQYATVRGRVIDASGKPFANVQIGDDRVEMWGSDKMPVQTPNAAVTDADGKFEVVLQAEIPHFLLLSSPGYSGKTTTFTPQPNATMTVQIIGEHHPVLEHFEGMVVDPDGKPLAGVTVWENSREQVVTDLQGNFRVPRREAGKGRLSARKGGYVLREWTDVVGPDEPKLLLILHPGGAPRSARRDPPDSKLLVGNPAPPIKVESWVQLTDPFANPPKLGGGRKTLLMFTATYDNRQRFEGTIDQWLTRLHTAAAGLDAQPVAIFTAFTHSSGLRGLAKSHPYISIGVDSFWPEGGYTNPGVTHESYGGKGSTRVFLIDENGKVISDDFDLDARR